ncbi:MAG: glycosyltransferase [Victivallales bacterium]|nr:glycosyltransferase [Victivallales bacterium]
MIPCSLVTTCRNEMCSFPYWKANMQAQTRFPDEIVIVDAFSNDGTWEAITNWAKEDSRITAIQEGGNAAHGRNFAIQNAKYDHIISTDMGVRLADCFCEELMHPFEEDSEMQLVIGNTCIDPESVKTLVAKTEWYIQKGGFESLTPEGSIGGNRSSAYLKKIWQECGGLPEDLTFYADDSTLFRQYRQAGYKYAFAPKAMTYWGRTGILSKYWREAFVYGRGDGEAAIKMSRSFKYYLQGRIPAWLETVLNASRYMQKQFHLSAVWNSLKAGDIGVMFMMPVFAFGIGWNQSKGYHVGYANGREHCQACRARLLESKQNIAYDKRFSK